MTLSVITRHRHATSAIEVLGLRQDVREDSADAHRRQETVIVWLPNRGEFLSILQSEWVPRGRFSGWLAREVQTAMDRHGVAGDWGAQ